MEQFVHLKATNKRGGKILKRRDIIPVAGNDTRFLMSPLNSHNLSLQRIL